MSGGNETCVLNVFDCSECVTNHFFNGLLNDTVSSSEYVVFRAGMIIKVKVSTQLSLCTPRRRVRQVVWLHAFLTLAVVRGERSISRPGRKKDPLSPTEQEAWCAPEPVWPHRQITPVLSGNRTTIPRSSTRVLVTILSNFTSCN
jgi:hypothetical protein